MGVRIFTVDAFTDRPFAGNPAGVCLLDDLPAVPDAPWMQAVAAEMNLAETAFLRRQGDGTYALRWFTPAVEVNLCGHATLASAHLLFEEGIISNDQPAEFDTRSGRLTVPRKADEGRHSALEMDLPLWPVEPVDVVPAALRDGLGVEIVSVAADSTNYVVELVDEATVRAVQPNMALLS